MKKLVALFLALVMVVNLALTAAATETADEQQIADSQKYAAAIAAAQTGEKAEESELQIEAETVIRMPSMNAANNYESEPNNDMATANGVYNAMVYEDYTTSGTVSGSDPIDFFKFTLDSTSEVLIFAGAYNTSLLFGIWNAADELVGVGELYDEYEGVYLYVLNEVLPAGTYYLIMMDENDNYNEYAFTIGWQASDVHAHSYAAAQTVPATCAADGYTLMKCSCGDTYTTNYVPATGNHLFDDYKDANCNVCSQGRTVKAGVMPVYRLYNLYTQEHLLTSSDQEKYALVAAGWKLDGVAWEAPENGVPVYRLYNPYDDWHTYTISASERDTMKAAGWKVDGVVSCGYDGNGGKPIYRLFNPYVKANFHLFTAGVDERDMLVNAGWKLEGLAWMALN